MKRVPDPSDKIQYAVWCTDTHEFEPDPSYWELFNCLDDAVTAHPDEPIYEATFRIKGHYKIERSIVPVSSSKGKKK